MGRTPTPLNIGFFPGYLDKPEVQALADKGHLISAVIGEWDLIVHPRAWRMTPEMWAYLEVMLKGARAAKKEGKNAKSA